MAELIKIDRNGSKHWRGNVKCDRCGGTGIYIWGAMINGSPQYAGTCFKCGGVGLVTETWIERTPEYQAKLDAKKQAKMAERQAKIDATNAKIEAERKAEEERLEAERRAEEARKAISQFVGEVGERVNLKVTLDHTAWYHVRDMFGREEARYVHTFKDADGNKFVWKTGSCPDWNEGDPIDLTGTIKEHSEYKGEKQTVLTRCKGKVHTAE